MSELYNKMFPSKSPLMQSVVEKEKKKGYYGPDGVPNVPREVKEEFGEDARKKWGAFEAKKLTGKAYTEGYEEFANDSTFVKNKDFPKGVMLGNIDVGLYD